MLVTLVKVLPQRIWVEDEDYIIANGRDLFSQAFEHDPSAKDWNRLHRYTSRMCRLHLDCSNIRPSVTLFRLSSNSPGGLLFPKLESLYCNILEEESALPFFHLFLSPNLQRVTLSAYPNLSDIPNHRLEVLAQMISHLPTSPKDLTFMCGQGKCLNDAVSPFVCRCGSSLRSF